MELIDPVASALDEISVGTTKESIFYNYLQHCRNVAAGRVTLKEESLLPTLNKAIINLWGAASLDSMKKRAWSNIEKKTRIQNQKEEAPHVKCKFCPNKRGKLVTLGCLCQSHKGCSIKQIMENLKSCRETCLLCNNPIQRPQTLIKALQSYFAYQLPFKLKTNSLQPVIYYYHDHEKDESKIDSLNHRWREFCEIEAEKLPSWARPTLIAASKKKIQFKFSGSKWDF